MISLGLDPSLRSYGWCIYDGNKDGVMKRVESGHEGTLRSQVPIARFIHFRSLVRDIISRFPGIKVIGIESPAIQAGPFQSIHYGLMMYSIEAIFEKRINCVLFDPATVKYLVKGDPKKKGTIQKLDVQRFVQLDTLDTKIINNDEADAYAIARFSWRFQLLKDGLIKPEELSQSEFNTFIGRTKKSNCGMGSAKRTAHVFRENSRFFDFSKVPNGRIDLPKKSDISKSILEYLECKEEEFGEKE
jgi:Holliday junction resolvasome RuvABC endonuclease subunit